MNGYLNNVLTMTIGSNTVQDYLLALVTFLGILGALSVLKRFITVHLGRMAARTESDFDDFIVGLISEIGWPVFTVVALFASASMLTLPAKWMGLVKSVMLVVISIRFLLLAQKILQYGVHKALVKPGTSPSPSSQALVQSVTWVLKWVLWAVGAVFILDNLGINISALMAGIGIGGVAVAMASQAILGDAFSALCIYLDKPFEVGDFIIIDDSMGVVEHIGIKTTRIRSLWGEQLIFANTDLTKSRIKNYKRMEVRRIVFKVGVEYDTSADKLEKIPQLIREIIQGRNDTRFDRAHFQSFGDFSLNYEIAYYVLSADYNIYMDIQQDINLKIVRAFEREGIAFAFPTQTLYLKRGPQVQAPGK